MRNPGRKTKNLIKATMFMGTLALGIVLASPLHADVEPTSSIYFGADVGIKNTGFKGGNGNSIFKSPNRIGRVFVGAELTPNLSLEFYYSKKKMSGSHTSSTKGGSISQDVQAKFFNVGADLIRKFDTSYKNIKPLVGVGVERTKVDISVHGRDCTIDLSKSKLVLKALAGIEYMFNSSISARALATIENTNRVKHGGIIKLKNSYGASLGMLIKI